MKASKVIGTFSLMFVMGLPTLAQELPGTPTIQVKGRSGGPVYYVDKGVTISMTCKSDPSDVWATWSWPSYEWYTLSSRQRLKVAASATVNINSTGIYQCRVGRTKRGVTLWSYLSYSIALVVREPDDSETPDNPKIIWFPKGPIHVGDTITMICLADLDGRQPDDSFITWHNREADQILSPHLHTSTADQDYIRIFSKKVELADSGNYSCRAIYDEDEKTSKEGKLVIIDYPTITDWPEHSTLAVGDALSLKCSTTIARGSLPSYRWFKDSAVLPQSTTATYSKQNVETSDAGEYLCSVDESDGSASNSTVRTLFVKEAETWKRNCSTMWTKWMSRDPKARMEYRNQFCAEISSRGKIRNWTLELEDRAKRASTFDASFRSRKKTFTKALLNQSSDDFKALKTEFTHLLQKVYKDSDNATSDLVKEVNITGFKQGSVIVHFRVILYTAMKVTDPVANISKTLADYLNKHTADAEEYGITPSSVTSSGECMADQSTASSRIANTQNKTEVILAVTLTFIMLLVVVVVVLVFFLLRLKRSLLEKESLGENVAFHADGNGSGRPAVIVKDRTISHARSDFDPYAALGDKNVYADNEYGSLGEQKRIARPKGDKDNAAYASEDGDYLDIIGDGRVVSPSLQAELEDGYRVNEADAPEPGGEGAESVYTLAEGTGDVYAIPDKEIMGKSGAPVFSQAFGTKPEPVPGKTTSYETQDAAVYSLEGIPRGKPKPSQSSLANHVDDDSAEDYSQPYGRAPGAKYPDKNKKGLQGNVLSSNGDGDEYSRLQLPTLTKPSTMQYLEKKPKQMKGLNSAQEDVQDDDEADYEYSTACEVIP
ncbi:uncharacterized protein LOC135502080 [Lineus longissimus]|uniref:uncharacterized protein LOC135502080 n=1 Tax=Lineus longissimus TaxID=88925 RepID=UPI00315C9703